jgi:hypothetical protein
MTFAQTLQMGKIGESLIAKWFMDRGFSVLPVYELEKDTGKGPQIFRIINKISDNLIAPDMLIFRAKECYWIEAKHKTAFTDYRKGGGRRQTGIDLRHYKDYCKIDDYSPWPVWLLFLHKGGQAKDSKPSPAGLFGNTLEYLREHEDHTSPEWGKSGMVYWNIDDLINLTDDASLFDLSPVLQIDDELQPIYDSTNYKPEESEFGY